MSTIPLAQQVSHRLTVDDIFAFRDDKRYELIGGQISMVPPPDFPHQDACMRLAARLWNHVQANGLGVVVASPVAVILG